MVLQAGQAGACPGCHLFPGLPQARLKAARQSGQRKLRAWGAEPSPTSLLGSGTKRPLPGYSASLLHQQSVSIPFLQELPRAPRKGDANMGPQPRWSPSPESLHFRGGPWLGREARERLDRGCPGTRASSLALSPSWGKTVRG